MKHTIATALATCLLLAAIPAWGQVRREAPDYSVQEIQRIVEAIHAGSKDYKFVRTVFRTDKCDNSVKFDIYSLKAVYLSLIYYEDTLFSFSVRGKENTNTVFYELGDDGSIINAYKVAALPDCIPDRLLR